MCVMFCAVRLHPKFRFIALLNRDEYYARPTEPAYFWASAPRILAGKDLRSGGTWMGVSETSRFAALTNYRNPALFEKNKKSRGLLVPELLKTSLEPSARLSLFAQEGSDFNPFNLITATFTGAAIEAHYFSSIEKYHHPLETGLYGLSNGLLDSPWPKIMRGKERFDRILRELRADTELPTQDLLQLMEDQEPAPLHDLPSTGVAPEIERALSPIFIVSPEYGTRSTTLIAVTAPREGKSEVLFVEKSHPRPGDPTPAQIRTFDFPIFPQANKN